MSFATIKVTSEVLGSGCGKQGYRVFFREVVSFFAELSALGAA